MYRSSGFFILLAATISKAFTEMYLLVMAGFQGIRNKRVCSGNKEIILIHW